MRAIFFTKEGAEGKEGAMRGHVGIKGR